MSSTSSLSSSSQAHRAPSQCPQAPVASKEPTHRSSLEGTNKLARLIRREDSPERVKEIVKVALLDHQNSDGDTILMLAIVHLRVKSVEVLLDAGANPALRNNKGRDALSLAENLPRMKIGAFARKPCTTKSVASVRKKHMKYIAALIIDKIFSMKLSPYPENTTTLMLAAREGRSTSVDLLLGIKESTVDLVNANKTTALMYAAMSGNLPTLTSLLRVSKGNINTLDDEGDTALILAVERDHIPIPVVKKLIAAKADVNVTNTRKMSPLMMATRGGDIEMVDILIEAGADVDARDDENDSALIMAAEEGHVELVTLIGKKMKDLNSGDNGAGWEAISKAAYSDKTASVKALIALGVRIDLENPFGKSALKSAASCGNPELVRMLIDSASRPPQKAAINSALREAAKEGHCVIIDQMVALKADVSASGAKGNTALILAAQMGHTGAVEKLAALGASLDTRTAAGWTALMCAAKEGHIETVGLLIELGAYVYAQDPHGMTAFIAAAANGHKEVVEVFLASKRIKPASLSPERALIKAAEGGYLAIVDRIIPLVSTLDMLINGQSPLMQAAEKGHGEVVNRLIQAKASLDMRGPNKRTALMVAVLHNQRHIIEILSSGGANKNLRDAHGWTALMLAYKHDRTEETAKLLLGLKAQPLSEVDRALLQATVKEHG